MGTAAKNVAMCFWQNFWIAKPFNGYHYVKKEKVSSELMSPLSVHRELCSRAMLEQTLLAQSENSAQTNACKLGILGAHTAVCAKACEKIFSSPKVASDQTVLVSA